LSASILSATAHADQSSSAVKAESASVTPDTDSGQPTEITDGSAVVSASVLESRAGVKPKRPNYPFGDPRRYGAVGDGKADDTQALIDAIAVAGTSQAAVVLPRGIYRYTSPLRLTHNVLIVGQGANFGSRLLPDGTHAFEIVGSGAKGGSAFRVVIRDVMFDGSIAGRGESFGRIGHAYRVELHNVWLRDVDSSQFGSCLKVFGKANVVTLRQVYCEGRDRSTGVGLEVAVDEGQVSLYSVDFENFQTAMRVNSGDADFYSPYVERFGIGLAIISGASHVNVFGGLFRLSGKSAIGIRVGGAQGSGTLNVVGSVFSGATEPGQIGLDIRAATKGFPVNVFGVPDDLIRR